MKATEGAYKIDEVLWDVPLTQVFWLIVSAAKNNGVEGVVSPSEIKKRKAVFESAEFLEAEAKFLASKKNGKKRT